MHGIQRTQPIEMVLVEDNEIFGTVLEQGFAGIPDLVLRARVHTLAEGLALLNGPPAGIMLVDLGLPDGSGVDLIGATRRAWPACQIMVLSVFGDEANVIRSIEAGAQGYLLKDTPAGKLADEIRILRDGGSPISPKIARHVLNRLTAASASLPDAVEVRAVEAAVPSSRESSLSVREIQVLTYIAKGFTHDEIAQNLNISRYTVLTFVRRIYAKLEVHSKIEAVNIARSRGLVDD